MLLRNLDKNLFFVLELNIFVLEYFIKGVNKKKLRKNFF